jgi:hypothetical protein
MRFRSAMTTRGENAARGGRRRHCRLTEKLPTRDSKHHNPKEEHGEEEKEIANSPKRRKRAQTNPQAPTTSNRTFLGFQAPRLDFTWLGSVFRWKKGWGGSRRRSYSTKTPYSVRRSQINRWRYDGSHSCPTRSRHEVEEGADKRAPSVSETLKGETRGCNFLGRPTRARGGAGDSVRWPISEREQGRPTRAGLQAASSTAGKSFSFLFVFKTI